MSARGSQAASVSVKKSTACWPGPALLTACSLDAEWELRKKAGATVTGEQRLTGPVPLGFQNFTFFHVPTQEYLDSSISNWSKTLGRSQGVPNFTGHLFMLAGV